MTIIITSNSAIGPDFADLIHIIGYQISLKNAALNFHQRSMGRTDPFRILKGNIVSVTINLKIASTAIPSKRKGRARSQTIGYKIIRAMTMGQQSIRRISQRRKPVKDIWVFFSFTLTSLVPKLQD
jgi:hypothetical protein